MSGTDAEARRQRLGSLSAGLMGKAPRKRAEEVLPDLAPPRVEAASEVSRAEEPREKPKPVAEVPSPVVAAEPAPSRVEEGPDAASPAPVAPVVVEAPEQPQTPAPAKTPELAGSPAFTRDTKPGVHRVVMNLPVKSAEVLNRARGQVGRTHAEVVFAALEQAVRERRLVELVHQYENQGSDGDYFQRQTPMTGGGVVQIQLRLSEVNRDALDRLVTFAEAKSRTALVAAALTGFRF